MLKKQKVEEFKSMYPELTRKNQDDIVAILAGVSIEEVHRSNDIERWKREVRRQYPADKKSLELERQTLINLGYPV